MEKPCPYEFDFCVLIPCFNNEEGLVTSLNSIVYNPDRFCIVVVDDGSKSLISTESLQNKLTYRCQITVLRNASNRGITFSLNRGLQYIDENVHSVFIARLDCDDTCSPQRFTRQVEFLRENPQVDLVGSWCYFTDPCQGTAYKYKTPTRHEAIARSMYFRNVFIHPTVMWRAGAGGRFKYPEQFPHAEDYGLFYDIVRKRKSAIIDEYLVSCALSPGGLSLKYRKDQLKSRLRVITHFRRSWWLWLLGAIKLRLLLFTPYHLVLSAKRTLYKA